MEVQTQIGILGQVTHNCLQGIGAVGHGRCRTARIQEHANCVVSVLRRNLLDEEGASIGRTRFQALVKDHSVQLLCLIEEIRGNVGIDSLETREKLAMSNI